MFLKHRCNKTAQSAMEYIALVIFLLAAMLVFQRYIFRGFAGGWKKAGDTFGQGRQYDPRPFGTDGLSGGSKECFYDATHCQPGLGPPCTPAQRMHSWIDKRCTELQACDCTLPWEDPTYQGSCLTCYALCRSPACGSNYAWP